jgi:anti-sigma B factor antagonist
MAQATLETTVRATADGPVIMLRGDIDGTAKEALIAAYDDAPKEGRLLLDFAAVDYINSTGIALIVGLLARARSEHRAVVATGLSDHYRQIFEITRIADFMTILDNHGTLNRRVGNDGGHDAARGARGGPRRERDRDQG